MRLRVMLESSSEGLAIRQQRALASSRIFLCLGGFWSSVAVNGFGLSPMTQFLTSCYCVFSLSNPRVPPPPAAPAGGRRVHLHEREGQGPPHALRRHLEGAQGHGARVAGAREGGGGMGRRTARATARAPFSFASLVIDVPVRRGRLPG